MSNLPSSKSHAEPHDSGVPDSVRIIIPTYNAGGSWPKALAAVLRNTSATDVLILDSTSRDDTANYSRQEGCTVVVCPTADFNHGRTRKLGIELSRDYTIAVFLTQDAVLAGEVDIATLVASFSDSDTAAAYGRQLPNLGATPVESHARTFNYGPQSSVKDFSSRFRLGFKAIFISNSFSAYRISALKAVGGFPSDTIFGEDTITAAKLLKAGWKIAYVAEAQVYHSHSYTWRQEFRRYFDIGVLHSREHWLIDEFGGASGEGARFVRSELAYLWPKHWWLIPSALIRTALKLAGYKLGKLERHLPKGLKRQLSMNRGYWK